MTIGTDEQLVIDARNGNKDSFRELVKRLEPRVAATVKGMLGQCPEADDVGQETFIRFYRALDTYRGESSVASYITRIAINLSLNEIKRRKRFFSRFVDSESDEVAQSTAKTQLDSSFDDRDAINWALQKLEPNYRTVLVLRLVDGYSTAEAAEILKLPIGTVTSRLARAQKKMRDTLMPFYGGER